MPERNAYMETPLEIGWSQVSGCISGLLCHLIASLSFFRHCLCYCSSIVSLTGRQRVPQPSRRHTLLYQTAEPFDFWGAAQFTKFSPFIFACDHFWWASIYIASADKEPLPQRKWLLPGFKASGWIWDVWPPSQEYLWGRFITSLLASCQGCAGLNWTGTPTRA
jgi:hypothetical protein